MSDPPLSRLFALLPLFAPSALQGGVDLFEGPATLPGEVRSYSETSGAPLPPVPGLAGVRFLPLDVNGCSLLDGVKTDPVRRGELQGGAGFLRLPGGRGSLLHFERVELGGGLTFGFLHLDATGAPTPLAELPGIGPTGDEDPWLGRVAVDPGGERFLSATKKTAGGDVFEVSLATGAAIDRSANLPPLHWYPNSLRLGPSFGVAVNKRGAFRFGNAPGALAELVPFGTPRPAWFSGELAMSNNGRHVVTTAGRDPAFAHVWVFSRLGEATRVTTAPGPVPGAGFLPEEPSGPHMAVSNDGRLAAWREPGGSATASNEAFLARVLATSAAPVHVTNDVLFTDTLDEVGLLTFFRPDRLFLAVGEKGAVGEGVTGLDFFEARLNGAGQPELLNLSATSGEPSPPFFAIPDIEPTFVHWSADGGGLVVHTNESGGGGKLLLVRSTAPGAVVLLDEVKNVEFVVESGGQLAIALRRSTNDAKVAQLYSLPTDFSGPLQLVLSGTESQTYLAGTAGENGTIAFLSETVASSRTLHRVHLPSSTLETYPTSGVAIGERLEFTPQGGLALSLQLGTLTRFVVWPPAPAAEVILQAPTGTGGEVLPGS